MTNAILKVILTSHLIIILRADAVIVRTKLGDIKGQVISMNNEQVAVFKSIRFGQPPVGNLRFKKPEPVLSWPGVYDANRNHSTCYPTVAKRKAKGQSEDCLFLSVWTGNLSNQAKQPVMIWFKGVSHYLSDTSKTFGKNPDGTALATHQIVVVTVNYRLGNLGFFYDGTEEAPGNAGLFDQVLALKWVRKNIKFFGGDRKKVTIAGQSIGSWSVGLHLISPLSKELFSRAILQSGSPYYFFGQTINNQKILKRSKKIAKHNNCSGKHWIKCLKMIEPHLINKPIALVGENPFPTVVVNDFIPDGIKAAAKIGKINIAKEVLAGVNKDEGSIFASNYLLPQINLTKKVVLNRIEITLTLLRNKWKIKKLPSLREVFTEYFSDLSQNQFQDQDQIKQRFSQFIGDYLIACPIYFQMKDYVRSSPNASVFFYRLSQRASIPLTSTCGQQWMGVCHAEDLPFVFGYPIKSPMTYNFDDYQTALLMMFFWTNFVKTGYPMTGKPPANLKVKGVELCPNVKWNQFILKDIVMAMDLNSDKLKYVANPFDKCKNFWRKFFK